MSTVTAFCKRVSHYLEQPKYKIIAGDIEGTTLRLAVLKGDQIEKELSIPMADYPNMPALADRVTRGILAFDVLVAYGGISFPGPIDKSGEPDFTLPNLPFGLNGFVKQVSEKIGIKFFGLTDVRCQAMGEAIFGAGRTFDRVAWYRIDTEYGWGAIAGELEVLPDARGGGHFKVVNPLLDPAARLCSCGVKGCVGAYVSGLAMAREYHKLTGKNLNGKEVGLAFLSGDSSARQVVDEAMTHLAMALSTGHSLMPSGIHVLGGSVSQMGDPLLQMLRDKINTPGMVSDADQSDLANRIVLTQLGDRAGLLGAGVLTGIESSKKPWPGSRK